jgi:hypothetical protein
MNTTTNNEGLVAQYDTRDDAVSYSVASAVGFIDLIAGRAASIGHLLGFRAYNSGAGVANVRIVYRAIPSDPGSDVAVYPFTGTIAIPATSEYKIDFPGRGLGSFDFEGGWVLEIVSISGTPNLTVIAGGYWTPPSNRA